MNKQKYDLIFGDEILRAWSETFDAGGRYPMISKRIFETKQDATDFVNDYTSSGTAIQGLILTVINDGDNDGAYIVKKIKSGSTDTDGIIEKIESGDINLDALRKAVGLSGKSSTTIGYSAHTTPSFISTQNPTTIQEEIIAIEKAQAPTDNTDSGITYPQKIETIKNLHFTYNGSYHSTQTAWKVKSGESNVSIPTNSTITFKYNPYITTVWDDLYIFINGNDYGVYLSSTRTIYTLKYTGSTTNSNQLTIFGTSKSATAYDDTGKDIFISVQNGSTEVLHNNIVKVTSSGTEAFSSLEYDEYENKLTFTNTNGKSDIYLKDPSQDFVAGSGISIVNDVISISGVSNIVKSVGLSGNIASDTVGYSMHSEPSFISEQKPTTIQEEIIAVEKSVTPTSGKTCDNIDYASSTNSIERATFTYFSTGMYTLSNYYTPFYIKNDSEVYFQWISDNTSGAEYSIWMDGKLQSKVSSKGSTTFTYSGGTISSASICIVSSDSSNTGNVITFNIVVKYKNDKKLKDNTINITSNGIESFSDLDYNISSNTLTYTNTNGKKDIYLVGKQNTLVNQKNIASVNGKSLLDGGDIEIPSGITYIQGDCISINDDHEISVSGISASATTTSGTKIGTVKVGDNITEFYAPSSKTYTAGSGISIDSSNKISVTGISASAATTSGTKIGTVKVGDNITEFYAPSSITYSNGNNIVISGANNSINVTTLFRTINGSAITGDTTDIIIPTQKVEVTQEKTSGDKIGTITIDGIDTDLFCNYPSSGGGGGTYIAGDNISIDSSNNKISVTGIPTSFKTINNQDITGSGNITIDSGKTYTAGSGISIVNDVISVSGLSFVQGLTTGAKVGDLTINGKTTTLYCNYSSSGGSSSVYITDVDDDTQIDYQKLTAKDIKGKTMSEIFDILFFPEYPASGGTLPTASISYSDADIEVGSTIPTATSTTTNDTTYKYIKYNGKYVSSSYTLSNVNVTTSTGGKTRIAWENITATGSGTYNVTGPSTTVLASGSYLYSSKGNVSTVTPLAIGTTSKSMTNKTVTIRGYYYGGKQGTKNTSIRVLSDGTISINSSSFSTSANLDILTDTSTTQDHAFNSIGTVTVELPTGHSYSTSTRLTASKYDASSGQFKEDTQLSTTLEGLTPSVSKISNKFQDANNSYYDVYSYSFDTSSITTTGKFIIKINIVKN